MGQSASTSKVLQLLQGLKNRDGSITDIHTFKLDSKIYILIGETHAKVEAGTTPPFVEFLQELGCEEPLDIFIEGTYALKELFRFRDKSAEELAQQMTPELDTIGRVRLQAEMLPTCGEQLRVHAVDVRDPGYMNLLATPTGNLEQVKAYTFTLLYTNLDYVMRLINASRRKSDHPDQIWAFATRVARFIFKECNDILELENVEEAEPRLWKAYALLVDIYTFSRMLKRDNSKMLILYAGSNHTNRLIQVFEEFFKLEDLN
jgi:hypothetical protein